MEIFLELPNHLKYIITGLGSLLAVLGLFVDKNNSHFKFIAPMFIVLVCVLGFFQASDAINSDKDSEIAKDQRSNLLVLVDNSSIASLRTSSYLTDILLSQPKILKDFGLTSKRAGKPLENLSTAELIESEILAANKYRMELISNKHPSKRLRTKLWYYNKEIDTPALESALREMGFTVENQIAEENQADDPTNAVWYGPDVDFEDYKAVIVSLIRAGIDIRRTGPSCKNLIAKKDVIEIGSSDLA
ncbi:MAG: hypothetical protein ACI9RV_003031, partial [Glaciecola sp.]